jgi:hypothetical protein
VWSPKLVALRCADQAGCRAVFLLDRREKGDQFPGDAVRRKQRSEMPDPRQSADVRVGDVLGDMPRRIGKEGVEHRLPATQEQDGCGYPPEHVGIRRPGPRVGRVLLDESEHGRDAARPSRASQATRAAWVREVTPILVK